MTGRHPILAETVYVSHGAPRADGSVNWFVVEGGRPALESLERAGRTIRRLDMFAFDNQGGSPHRERWLDHRQALRQTLYTNRMTPREKE
jgi:hypothetical protein